MWQRHSNHYFNIFVPYSSISRKTYLVFLCHLNVRDYDIKLIYIEHVFYIINFRLQKEQLTFSCGSCHPTDFSQCPAQTGVCVICWTAVSLLIVIASCVNSHRVTSRSGLDLLSPRVRFSTGKRHNIWAKNYSDIITFSVCSSVMKLYDMRTNFVTHRPNYPYYPTILNSLAFIFYSPWLQFN